MTGVGAPAPARPAATVLVLRDGPAGIEVFLVERHAGLQFLGGAFVFPGGKLDPADLDPAVPCDLAAPEAARRLGEDDGATARGLHVAALRECLEEAGLLFTTPACPPETLPVLRAALATPAPPGFGTLLARQGLTLSARALVPLARWVTPVVEPRRYDTRFFLVRAPDGAIASPDLGETVSGAWVRPDEALERARRGVIGMVPPTWCSLELLAAAGCVGTALAMAPPRPPILEARVVHEDGAPRIVLPGDPLHGEPAVTLARAGVLAGDGGISLRFGKLGNAWVPVS